MLLSLKWLRDFVPYEGTAEELGVALTGLGLELENIIRPYDDIRELVVGHVLSAEPHPESDHLSVCRVDVGQGEPLDIVCGAPNVAAGQKVPVALVGTTMPGGLVIKKAKLRGVPSHGMICSERELGLTEDHSGIMVLPASFAVGAKVVEVLDLDTEVLEIGITPNRADALSVLGLAREVALAFKLPLTLPKVALAETASDWVAGTSLEVPEGDLAPLYMLRRLEGLSVAPSPAWMRYRLHAAGVRPLSNLVDVTNYILMELGQPLHAFDAAKVEGGGIIVSPAREGETLVTLDGQDRKLLAGDLLIRDRVKPLGLAGVMGGQNSEVVDGTSAVLLECAVFRPGSIRRTARRLGISSEASYRFERGVDQVGARYALERAAALMAELGGGTVCSGIKTLESRPWTAPRVVFRRRRAVQLLGVEVEAAFCDDTLTRLGCELTATAADTSPQGAVWDVTTPSWRQDLTREADLIEEVIRVRGMDTLPETLPAVSRSLERSGAPLSHHDFLLGIKRWASGLGLNEAENYSFVGHKDLDALNLPRDERISIMNPLSEDQNALRTAVVAGLLLNVRHNIAHGGGEGSGLRLFEVANAFYADAASQTTAREEPRLALALYGPRHDGGWPHGDADADYTDLRGLVDLLASSLHLAAPGYELVENHPYLAPAVRVLLNGQDAGVMGRVRPAMADAFYARKPIWVAELHLAAFRAAYDAARIAFAPLPVFPASTRDVTVAAPLTLRVGEVIDAINGQKVKCLEAVRLQDVFEPKDRAVRNLTFRLTFRHPERTLKDSEVDKEREKLAQALVASLGVEI